MAVSMTFEAFSELMLMTQIHYQAWLSAQYVAHPIQRANMQTERQTIPNMQDVHSELPAQSLF